MENFTPTSYTLECVATGREFEDAGWMMEDGQCDMPSLVRAKYEKKQLEVKSEDYGLYKFCDWLPIHRLMEGSSAPVTYKSKSLAAHLGLENLYVTFNGYNPTIGANMTTCSFKETEAYSVCGRMSSDEKRVLVVASAGNTARAFAKVCSDNNINLLLSVPTDNLNALWFEEPLKDCVRLIATEKGSDYFDAIHLGNLALLSRRFFAEGGAKNVARRDGMGTTVLSAVTTIGTIPDYYFQAVGSGTGAIAAWEANMRLIGDGQYGDKVMKLMVSQNAPFVPMYNAWRVDSREMLPYGEDRARRDVEIIDAKVLSNRKPPYEIIGGLYDALKATNGEMMVATNAQARKAARLFQELEGSDIHPASAVAVASLVKAVADGKVKKDAVVMLNITGGGEELFKKGRELWYLKPSFTFAIDEYEEDIIEKIETLFPYKRPVVAREEEAEEQDDTILANLIAACEDKIAEEEGTLWGSLNSDNEEETEESDDDVKESEDTLVEDSQIASDDAIEESEEDVNESEDTLVEDSQIASDDAIEESEEDVNESEDTLVEDSQIASDDAIEESEEEEEEVVIEFFEIATDNNDTSADDESDDESSDIVVEYFELDSEEDIEDSEEDIEESDDDIVEQEDASEEDVDATCEDEIVKLEDALIEDPDNVCEEEIVGLDDTLAEASDDACEEDIVK